MACISTRAPLPFALPNSLQHLQRAEAFRFRLGQQLRQVRTAPYIKLQTDAMQAHEESGSEGVRAERRGNSDPNRATTLGHKI